VIRFLLNYAAVLIKELKAVVITDLHIGIEREMGIDVKFNLKRMLERIRKIRESVDSNKLIILGDVKHEILKREEFYMKMFFGELSKIFDEIFVCKGNHDANLEKFLSFENVFIKGSRGFRIKNYGFLHGHANPRKDLVKCKKIFIGHFQPAIKIDSKIFKCFVEGKNFLILPSFNFFSGYCLVDEIQFPKYLKKDEIKIYPTEINL